MSNKGILPNIFGGSTLAAIDKALGIPTQTVQVQAPASPNANGLLGLGLPTESYLPQTLVVQSPSNSPFAEIVIPFANINTGLAAPYAPTNTTKPPLTINVKGQALVYKQGGSPPNARLTIELGSKIYVVQPGMRIVAPFDSFTIIRRNFLITDDFNNTQIVPNSVPTALGFSGESHFIVEKQVNIAYVEAYNDNIKPWFRPCQLMGHFDSQSGVGFAGVGATFQSISASPVGVLLFAASGCNKIRLGLQCNTAGTVQTGDVVSFHLAELFQVYELEAIYYNSTFDPAPPVGGWAAFESQSSNLKYETPSFTVPASTDTFLNPNPYVFWDFDVSDCMGGFALFYKNSVAHAAQVILQGVP